jgi:tetratricopeptide (TPR) repeat protein
MKPISIALGLVLAATATLSVPAAAQSTAPAAAAQEHTNPKLKPSKGAIKAIIDLQNAVNANDTANIPAKLAAAQAVAKTPEDRYFIAGSQYKAAVAAKNDAAKAAALEALIATGKTTPKETIGLYADLANTYTALKQSDRAAAALQHLLALDPNTAEAVMVLANSLKAEGKAPQAVAELQKQIAARKASGTKADESLYKMAVQMAYDAKLPSAMPIAREWVTAYPSPSNWANTFAIFQNVAALDESGLLDLLRLKRAAGALTSASDYHKYAYLAATKGFPGEAKAVLDEGVAAGKIDRTKSPFKEAFADVTPKAAADKAALAGAEAAGTKAAKAQTALANGDLLAGAGEYAKAATVYRAALGKSGADANTINLHLGAALAQQGDKAGATAALNAVTGSQAELAKLWLAYLATHA